MIKGYTPADNAALKTAVKDWCSDATSAENTYGQHISNWDTSSITSMDQLFCSERYDALRCPGGSQECSNFNDDISSWDVSHVTDMFGMFGMTLSFNGDLSSWDVSQVTNMEGMFRGSSFNGDLSSWDVSQVTNMDSMFSSASSFSQKMCWVPIAKTVGLLC